MTRLVLIMSAFAFICAGCGKEEPKPAREQVEAPAQIERAPALEKPAPAPVPAPELPAPAPEQDAKGQQESKGYFDIMIDARHQAKDLVALEPARQCVEAFKALEGRLPKDLDELKNAGVAPPKPPAGKQWSYNPETGEITLVPATE